MDIRLCVDQCEISSIPTSVRESRSIFLSLVCTCDSTWQICCVYFSRRKVFFTTWILLDSRVRGRKIWKSKDFKSRLHPPQLTSSWKAFLCRMHARVSIKSQVHMNSSFSNPRLLTFFKHFSLGQAQFLSGASYHGIDACFRRLCTYVFRRLASIFFFENPG